MAGSRVDQVAVIGGGPAGLRAAEVLAEGGCAVAVYEHKASVGRKFLVAGRGGLNLTHSEPLETFAERYGNDLPRWGSLLAGFSPQDLRAWAERLGVETYVGTSRRVFPVGQQAAVLLRRWVARLRGLGVTFHVNHRLEGLGPGDSGGWRLRLRETRADEARESETPALVLALGGASWPQTGSDGRWTTFLRELGVGVAPWQAANCGYEVAWDARVPVAAAGLPLKNIVLRAGGKSVSGEALITRYGLEGGAVYQLGPPLRTMHPAQLEIDLKPSSSAAQLLARLPRGTPSWDEIGRVWRLSAGARALLEFCGRSTPANPAALASEAKALTLNLIGPRPIEEAISSAGGVEWRELDDALMLRAHPGIFLAGEMIDWEAPTGGYLLQGCFSTATRAAQGAARYLEENDE